MNKVINIAIYSRDLGVGGIQKTLMNVLRILDDNSYKIDLFLFSDNVFFEDALPTNVTIIYKRQNALASRILPLFLHRFVYRVETDKIYDYAVDFDGFLNTQTAMTLNTPAKKRIVWVHTDIMNLYKYYIDRPVIFLGYLLMHLSGKRRYKYFDGIVGVSSPILEDIKKKYKKKEYNVIPNGIDSSYIIEKSKERAPVKFSENCYNLITVGRIAHPKNYPGTISAIANILQDRDDMHFYIVGDGRDKRLVIKEIKRQSLDKKITLLGATNNPYSYLAQADGFILNSRFEGQGIVLEEAQVFGVDLYYPARLSDYVPNLREKRKEFIELNYAKKTNKQLDYLVDYNNRINASIKKLFSGHEL